MKSKNLWGDFKGLKSTTSPKTFLKEQADKLETLTDGILRSEIIQERGLSSKEFGYILVIIARYLNNYKKTILEIGHDIDPYPVDVGDYVNDKSYECDDEATFLMTLEEILSSSKVRNIIASLISHSK